MDTFTMERPENQILEISIDGTLKIIYFIIKLIVKTICNCVSRCSYLELFILRYVFPYTLLIFSVLLSRPPTQHES